MLRQSPARRLCKYPNPATMHPLPSPSPRQLIMPATPHRVLTQIAFSRSKFRVTVRRTHFNNLEMLWTGGEAEKWMAEKRKLINNSF